MDLAAKEALRLDEFETFMDTAQAAEISPIEKGIAPEAAPIPGDELVHEEAPPEIPFEEAAPPPAVQEEPPALGVPESYETTFEGSDLGGIDSVEAPPLIEGPSPPPPAIHAEQPPPQAAAEKTGGPPIDLGAVPESAVREIIRETVERIVWEIVPELAETLIQEEIKKLKSKQ